MKTDPVCGMKVNPEKSENLDLIAVKEGKKYFFCSKSCLNQFLNRKKENKSKENKNKEEKGKGENSGIDAEIKNGKIKNAGIIKEVVYIAGMHCASCAVTIEKTLGGLPGIKKAEVNSATQKLYLEFDPNKINLELIDAKIKSIGYELVKENEKSGKSDKSTTVNLKIIGMDNPHCLSLIESALDKTKGVLFKELNINEKARITFDQSKITLEEIKRTIKSLGYEPLEESIDLEKETINIIKR